MTGVSTGSTSGGAGGGDGGSAIDRLAAVFPGMVTESLDADGNVVRAVDFDALRRELGEVVEGPRERYQLDWPGKRAAGLAANIPSRLTLRADVDESVDFDATGNLFIEGDNLEVLKLLQEPLLGQVKLIYIDPPYNTGSDFLYDDDFAESVAEYEQRSGQKADTGERLVATSETGGRFHSAWLSMMYPRLKLARTLLREDGVGFVSIDGNEVAQLKLLLAEVFGADNVVATMVWASNLKGRQLSDGGPAGTHEYLLCFARNARAISRFRGSAAELQKLMPAVYKPTSYDVKKDDRGPYVTKNELYNTNSKFNEQTAPTMVFRIHFHPATGEVRVSDIDDDTTYDGFVTAMPHPNARAGVALHAWRWSRAKVLAEHEELEFEVVDGALRIRTKIRDVDGTALKDLIIGPSTVTGQADLAELGLGQLFETPKPVALLETLIAATTSGDDLVLDFFAGSGATAHAVMARNDKDGGQRRFVLVQLDEACGPGSAAAAAGFDTIAAIGRERVRRAGAKFGGVDVGFRALRLSDGMRARAARDTDQADLSEEGDRSLEDLLVAAILELGIDPTLPVVREAGDSLRLDRLDVRLKLPPEEAPDSLRLDKLDVRVVPDSAFTDDAHRLNVEHRLGEVGIELVVL